MAVAIAAILTIRMQMHRGQSKHQRAMGTVRAGESVCVDVSTDQMDHVVES